MKQWVSAILFFIFCVAGNAQMSVGITTGKTSSFIFPSAILHVDRGAPSVLVQAVSDASNILLVKAASSSFESTNLSVVTRDGKVYSLLLHYDSLPASFLHVIAVPEQQIVRDDARYLLNFPKTAHGMKDKALDIQVKVTGIFVRHSNLYLQLRLINKGPLDYKVEQLQMSLRDRKKSKRTAFQEIDVTPLTIAGNTKVIKGFSESCAVIAVQQFTIPDAKMFAIRILEGNGGRHLKVTIKNKDIIKARPLRD